MPFRPPPKPPGFADLKVSLAQSQLTEEPLYQTVQEIIERLDRFQNVTATTITRVVGGGGGGGASVSASYLTKNNDTAILPGSRQLVAGTNVSLDDTVAGQLKINAASGGGGAGATETYLTSGNETLTLPNSRRLVAGTRITFDDSIANQKIINASVGDIEADVTTLETNVAAIKDADLVTFSNETPTFPSSRVITAGTNVTLGTGTPGQIIINASGGGGGADNEVFVGPSDPGSPPYELWYDTDAAIATVPPIQSGPISGAPTPGPGDAGLLYQVLAPYWHTVRWNGTAWEFAPGDCGNGFFSDRPFAPQEGGWQFCDGSATDYLKVGGPTLTTQPFTTPNLTTGTYLKSYVGYNGAINPATGSTIPSASNPPNTDWNIAGGSVTNLSDPVSTGLADRSLSSTTTPGGSHSHGDWTNYDGSHTHNAWTDTQGDHAHTVNGSTGNASAAQWADAGTSFQAAQLAHTHDFGANTNTTGGHGHNIGMDAGGSSHRHFIGADGSHTHTSTTPDHQHVQTQHMHTIPGHYHLIPDHGHSVPPTEVQHLLVMTYFRR